MHRVYLGIFLNFPLLGFLWAFFLLTQDILRIQNQLSLLLFAICSTLTKGIMLLKADM